VPDSDHQNNQPNILMSLEEREAFARDGSLPDWFSRAIGTAPGDGQGAEKGSEVNETQRLQ
jgi:hypothetical protein